MRLTGHTSRTIFDRDPSIHEQELPDAEDELVASLARQAQAPRRRTHRTDNPCIGVDDARPDHRGGESHAARFAGAHPASESCDGVAGEGALRQSCRNGQARESRDDRGPAGRCPTGTARRVTPRPGRGSSSASADCSVSTLERPPAWSAHSLHRSGRAATGRWPRPHSGTARGSSVVRPQTSGATQRCLNLGFSERIGNSRRTGCRTGMPRPIGQRPACSCRLHETVCE